MSREPYDKRTLIQHRLERARESLGDAQALIQQGGSPVGIVNRAYYAMFYAVLGLLITIDKGTSKHSGAIAMFDEYFIKQNIFSKEMGKTLHQAFDMRMKGDYRDMQVISMEQAIEIYNSAYEFFETVEERLSKNK